MDEEWRLYEEVPIYEVSSLGRVRNKNTQHILQPCLSREKNGYYKVHLYYNNKNIMRYIHRMVAITFIPNPNNLPYVNHLNWNTRDNRVENLEWVSPKGNQVWRKSKQCNYVQLTFDDTWEPWT